MINFATNNNTIPIGYLNCGRGDPIKQGTNLAILEFGIGYIYSADKVTEKAKNHQPSEDGGKLSENFLLHSCLSNTAPKSFTKEQLLSGYGKRKVADINLYTNYDIRLAVCR